MTCSNKSRKPEQKVHPHPPGSREIHSSARCPVKWRQATRQETHFTLHPSPFAEVRFTIHHSQPKNSLFTLHPSQGSEASLLEVGTGFHPELTGRENIFLNGAILGMGREEIKRKFDEIVDFAEVERFLDTPVKRYSSGMYERLAFALAAHLEPEILIVDEVLAVGDAQFQKKCLGKMGEVGSEGRTVVCVLSNGGDKSTLKQMSVS